MIRLAPLRSRIYLLPGERLWLTPTDHGAHGADAAHGAEAAFPPFDPTYFGSQLFWFAIAFIALYLFLSRSALPRIATVIEERQDKIADDLDQAADLKRQGDDAVAAYEADLAEAKAKAGAIASDTRASLDAEISRMQAETDEQLAQKTESAEARIAKAKEAALVNVREIAGDTARGIVSKLTGVDASASDVDAAIQSALAGRA